MVGSRLVGTKREISFHCDNLLLTLMGLNEGLMGVECWFNACLIEFNGGLMGLGRDGLRKVSR